MPRKDICERCTMKATIAVKRHFPLTHVPVFGHSELLCQDCARAALTDSYLKEYWVGGRDFTEACAMAQASATETMEALEARHAE